MKWSNHTPYTTSLAKYTLLLKQLDDTEKETNGEFKIFSFDYDFYTDNEQIKNDFERLFIQHYYFEEINAETVARWKHNLKSRLDIIAPYYKKLYETELRAKEVDFMLNKDLVEEILDEGSITNQSNSTSNTKGNSGSNTTIDNTTNNAFSDTPITGVNDIDKYMSSQNKDTFKGTHNTSITNDTNSTNNANGSSISNNKKTLISKGNIGVTSSGELLKDWRSVLIDINKMIIDDLRDLFLNIY